MICKYCGAFYTGRQCSACGKVFPLVRRSTELDQLMASPKAAAAASQAEAQDASGKRFEQGVREGYQKGLREGYENGLKEGYAAASKENEEGKNAAPKNQKKHSKLKTLLLCAAAFLIAVALGGVIAGTIQHRSGFEEGKQRGYEEGRIAAKTEYDQELENSREEERINAEARYETGKLDGRSEAEAEYNQKLSESADLAREDGYKHGMEDGLKQAMAEAEAQYGQKLQERYDEGYAKGKEDGIREASIFRNDEESLMPAPGLEGTTTESEEIIYSRETHQNKRDSGVQGIQSLLKEFGLYDGAVDGFFGPKTEEAVRQFQKTEGLKETGSVDRETLKRIVSKSKEKSETDQENTEKLAPEQVDL